MHNCPRCGQLTSGAWSEGGLKWAICDNCMSADIHTSEAERRPTTRRADGEHAVGMVMIVDQEYDPETGLYRNVPRRSH